MCPASVIYCSFTRSSHSFAQFKLSGISYYLLVRFIWSDSGRFWPIKDVNGLTNFFLGRHYLTGAWGGLDLTTLAKYFLSVVTGIFIYGILATSGHLPFWLITLGS